MVFIEVFQLEERELETRACTWTCPPHVVFDDLALRDSNPQQRCHSKHQGRRKSVGRQVDETRDDPSTAKPTKPDKSISGTSNPITAKPTRTDKSISGTSNPIAQP